MKNIMSVTPADAYYQALLDLVPRAKKRIVLAAMLVVWGERTAPLFAMLGEALARGVQVTILLDTFTKLTYLNGLEPVSTRSKRIKQTFASLKELAQKGAKVYTVGKINFPPHKERCHVKISVVDNRSFSFGGVNFYDQGFKLHDYMLESSSPEMADCLAQLVTKIGIKGRPLNDGVVQLTPTTHILFDGGRKKHSIIYERAVELAAQATRALYVSQMAPSGQLAARLNKINTTFYFNRPEQMNVPEAWAQAFDQQRYRTTNSHEGKNLIHAKYILFELVDGSKKLLSGSHNFSYRGVSYGTQEIALETSDEVLWNQLQAFTKAHILARKNSKES